VARSQGERDAEKRALKLAEINEQVEAGSLSIRQMTPEERERYRPRPRKPSPPQSSSARARPR
jgi:hypothetical protein